MKVIICGGRFSWPKARFDTYMDEFHQTHNLTLVMEGGARGIDQLAREWCKKRKVKNKTFPADWSKHGKSAGPLRIRQMLDEKPDKVIAFEGGIGTELTIKMAEADEIEVIRV